MKGLSAARGRSSKQRIQFPVQHVNSMKHKESPAHIPAGWMTVHHLKLYTHKQEFKHKALEIRVGGVQRPSCPASISKDQPGEKNDGKTGGDQVQGLQLWVCTGEWLHLLFGRSHTDGALRLGGHTPALGAGGMTTSHVTCSMGKVTLTCGGWARDALCTDIQLWLRATVGSSSNKKVPTSTSNSPESKCPWARHWTLVAAVAKVVWEPGPEGHGLQLDWMRGTFTADVPHPQLLPAHLCPGVSSN